VVLLCFGSTVSRPSLNTSVIEVDRSLAEMCRQSGHCLYLDLNSTVASTGAVADPIDGLHLGPNSDKDMGEHFEAGAQC
jgi:hypothetical protein